jgi:protein SCO1/2
MSERAPAPDAAPDATPPQRASGAAAPSAERAIWLGLGAIIVVVILAGLWSMRRATPDGAPPVLGEIPPFTLVERSGRAVSRDDLAGQAWVADFIFTRCTGMCPALSARMNELRRRVRDAGLQARLVSFSVDPNHDTPDVLRDYATRYAADDAWLFVTGERGALYRLIGEGFKLSVAERAPGQASDGGELITHSDRFVLVDAGGRIRGYYHGTEPDSVAALLRDLAALQPRG